MFRIFGNTKLLMIPTVLLLFSGHAFSADEIEDLGRLFIDVEQREKLEAVRRGTYQSVVKQENRVSNVRMDGVMTRSNGNNVVWINGESTLDGQPVKGISVNPQTADRETYSVQLKIDGKRVRLKPGQSWSEGTGTVKDNY